MLTKFGDPRRKDNVVACGRTQCRLITGRPEFACSRIAQINKSSPTIGCRILTPAGKRQVAPSAITATRVGDHYLILSVGQNINLRRAQRGAVEYSHPALDLIRSAF